MKQILLCTLLIAQCAIASDDDSPLALAPFDSIPDPTEQLITAIHERTTCCEYMFPGCPPYNRELTNQLFEDGGIWDSPAQNCTDRYKQCYVGARRAGYGYEHCAYAAGCAVCSITLPIAVMTPLSGTTAGATGGWLANFVLGALCIKSAQWASEDTEKHDRKFSNPENWGNRAIPLALMNEDSDSFESSESDEETSD